MMNHFGISPASLFHDHLGDFMGQTDGLQILLASVDKPRTAFHQGFQGQGFQGFGLLLNLKHDTAITRY